MQIVIDINEDVFTRLFDNGTEDYAIVNDDLFAIAKSIRKGTPLPKGHGDLIDRNKLKLVHRGYDNGKMVVTAGVSVMDIAMADVLIKADSEVSKNE